MKRRWVQFVGLFSAVLSILWLAGLGMTFQHYIFKGATTVNQPINEEVTEPTPTVEKVKKGIHVVALGDSLTVGAGDESGKGYIGTVIEELEKQTSEPITLTNYAINGLTSEGLLSRLQEDEVLEELKVADLIFVTIGGNDLFRGGQTLVELNLEDVTAIEQQFLQNLRKTIDTIRDNNKVASIYFNGLYHPFSHLPNSEITTKVIMDWNHQTALLLAKDPKTVFVPTYDLFQFQLEAFLSEDRFHPSLVGYEQIGKRIASLIKLGGEQNE